MTRCHHDETDVSRSIYSSLHRWCLFIIIKLISLPDSDNELEIPTQNRIVHVHGVSFSFILILIDAWLLLVLQPWMRLHTHTRTHTWLTQAHDSELKWDAPISNGTEFTPHLSSAILFINYYRWLVGWPWKILLLNLFVWLQQWIMARRASKARVVWHQRPWRIWQRKRIFRVWKRLSGKWGAVHVDQIPSLAAAWTTDKNNAAQAPPSPHNTTKHRWNGLKTWAGIDAKISHQNYWRISIDIWTQSEFLFCVPPPRPPLVRLDL